MEFEYDLFLCYNKVNKDWVRDLATSIESEKHNDRKLKVFFDEWDIKPGSNIVTELDKALSKSRFVGVVLSPEMLQAEWPTMEWTIAVHEDPSGRQGKVIPIWLGNCDIPAPLKIRNVLDCRNSRESKKSYSKLVSVIKNKPLPRGSSDSSETIQSMISDKFLLGQPDEMNEQLVSNLFPVTYFPRYIWSGPIGTLTHKDVFKHLRKKIKGITPVFLIKEKRLYSFWNLNYDNCPFKELLVAINIEKESIKPWISNTDKNNWLIELFNAALRGHCWDLNLRYDRNHSRFFFPPLGGEDRTESWHTGKRQSTRKITARHTKGKSKQIFWAHRALQAKFMNINNDLYLQLVPVWAFTSDGQTPLTGKEVGSFSTKWTAKEYNLSVFYNIRFWSSLLAKKSSKISMRLGNEKLDVDITPSVIELPVGIDGDYYPIDKVFEAAHKEIEVGETVHVNMLKMESQHE